MLLSMPWKHHHLAVMVSDLTTSPLAVEIAAAGTPQTCLRGWCWCGAEGCTAATRSSSEAALLDGERECRAGMRTEEGIFLGLFLQNTYKGKLLSCPVPHTEF